MKRVYEYDPGTEEGALKALVRRLENMDGVGFVRLNTRLNRLCLRFDPSEIDEEEITEAAQLSLTRVTLPPRTAGRRLLPVWALALAVVYVTLAEKRALPLPAYLRGLGGSIACLLLLIPLWIMCFDTVRLSARRRHLPAALAAAISLLYSAPALLFAAQGRDVTLMFDSAALLPAILCTSMRFIALRNRRLDKLFGGITGSEFPALTRAKRLGRIAAALGILASLAAFGFCLAKRDPGTAVFTAVCALTAVCPCLPTLFTLSGYACGRKLLEKYGIRTESPASLQMLSRTDTLVMTAGGILTEGVHSVASVETAEGVTPTQILALAASALQKGSDPVSRALVYEAARQNIPLDPLVHAETDAGLGQRALVGETRVLVGSYEFMLKNAMAPDKWEEVREARLNERTTDLYVASGGRILGFIALTAHLDSKVFAAFAGIKALGIRIIVLPENAESVPREELTNAGVERVIEKEDTNMNLRLYKADKRHMLYLYAEDSCPAVFEGTVPRLSLGGDETAELDGKGLDIMGVENALRAAARVHRTVRLYRHVWELITLGMLAASFFAVRLGLYPAQFMIVNLVLGAFAMFARPRRGKAVPAPVKPHAAALMKADDE